MSATNSKEKTIKISESKKGKHISEQKGADATKCTNVSHMIPIRKEGCSNIQLHFIRNWPHTQKKES